MILTLNIGKVFLAACVAMLLCCETALADGGEENGDNKLINCFYKRLYDFSFREADSLVVVISKTDIDNATLSNIKANVAWWKLLSGDAPDINLKSCSFYIDESIRYINKKQDINSLLNMIYSYSLKARLENYKGNRVSALFYFYKSKAYFEKCIEKQITDERLKLALGLYFYFTEFVEKEHFLVSTLFFPRNLRDKTKGLKYLEDCSASEDEMIRTEANYFLMKIYTYTEKNYSKAYLNSQILTCEHPDNFVFRLEELKLMLVLKKISEAAKFENRLLGEIQMAGNISDTQKNHFIYQVQQLANKYN